MSKRGKVIYRHMRKRNIHVQKRKVPSPYGEGWMHMNVPRFYDSELLQYLDLLILCYTCIQTSMGGTRGLAGAMAPPKLQ